MEQREAGVVIRATAIFVTILLLVGACGDDSTDHEEVFAQLDRLGTQAGSDPDRAWPTADLGRPTPASGREEVLIQREPDLEATLTTEFERFFDDELLFVDVDTFTRHQQLTIVALDSRDEGDLAFEIVETLAASLDPEGAHEIWDGTIIALTINGLRFECSTETVRAIGYMGAGRELFDANC